MTLPAAGWRHAFDLRPAFRNRRALGFTFAYACHGWELFAFRSFAVSFVAFCLVDGARALPFGLEPSDAAALVFLLGLPASVLGNELGHRYGRERMTFVIMWASAAVGLAVPFLALSTFWLLIPALLYDLIKLRRIHRAWVWGLALMLPWVVATEFAWGSEWWRQFGPKLVGAG